MKALTTHDRAFAHDRIAAGEALNMLNTNLRAKGIDPVRPEDVAWHFHYVIRIGSKPPEGFSDIHASIQASHLNICGHAMLSEAQTPLALDRVPDEIVAQRNPPRVSEENTPHIARVATRTRDGLEAHILITLAYQKRDDVVFGGFSTNCSYSKNALPSLYAKSAEGLRCLGGLRRVAYERLMAAGPDEEFTYRNMSMRRLGPEEIIASLDDDVSLTPTI